MDKQKEIEEIRRKAIGANLKLIECPIRHLGTEEGYKIYTRLQEHLLAQGITMEFNTMVRDIIIEGDTVKGIITDKDETYYAPEVVSAIGREGSDWFSHICGNHGIQTQVGTVDIGVRVEVRDEVMKFLNENLYEAKLVYYTPTFDDKVRTFCTNPSGEVATEYYENGLAVVNGHAYKSQEYKTNNTNFALLVSKNFTKPFNEPIEYGKHIAQLSNMLCGGRIMVQTIILLAISFPMATLDSLTLTIRLPLISETTVTTPPTTKPSSSRCLFTSSLPPILLIVKGSPAFTIDNGISSSLPLHLLSDKYYLYHVVSVF